MNNDPNIPQLPDSNQPQPPIIPVQPIVSSAPQKGNGKLFAIILAVVLLAVLAGGGYFASQSMQQQKPGATSTVTNNNIPDGWKKYSSKKHSISFIAPNEWKITEADIVPDGVENMLAGYIVHIQVPEDDSIGVDFRIIEGKLDELIKKQTSAFESVPGYTFKTSSTTWKTYDARRLSTTVALEGQKEFEIVTLFAQINESVYTIPEFEHPPTVVGENKIKTDNWRTFTNSIEIK